jgi:hypothetical protein
MTTLFCADATSCGTFNRTGAPPLKRPKSRTSISWAATPVRTAGLPYSPGTRTRRPTTPHEASDGSPLSVLGQRGLPGTGRPPGQA